MQNTSKKLRAIILLDKNPYTSFGRVAQTIVHALSPIIDIQIVYLQSQKYCSPTNTPPNALFAKAQRMETGRFTWPAQVLRIVKSIQPHWVLIIRPELSFFVPILQAQCPQTHVTIMIHDTFAETLYPNSLKFKLINHFFIKHTPLASSFLYNSAYTQTQAENHFAIAHKPGFVVGCVIDRQTFFPATTQNTPYSDTLLKQQYKTQWGFNPQQPLFLNISLDEPRKNIQSFFALAKLFPQALFLRVGPVSRWMTQMLQQERITNVIHYQNISIEKIRQLYQMCTALIYPSFLEGFGLPPLECLACGTPVISANSSALGENLQGIALLADPPDNLAQLQQFVQSVLEQQYAPPWDIVTQRLEQFAPHQFQQTMQTVLSKLLPESI